MKIGKQLQDQRKQHNMSQEDLAAKLNISRQAISKWENGTSLPSFTNVIAISNLFDISLDELIKEDPALIKKFEHEKIGLTKVETIITVGFVLAFIVLGVCYFYGVTSHEMMDWISLFELVTGIGFLTNIKWKLFNKSLNKRAVIFGILLLALFLIPQVMNAIPEIIKGIDQGISYGS